MVDRPDLTNSCSQRLRCAVRSMSIFASVIPLAAHLRLPEPWLSFVSLDAEAPAKPHCRNLDEHGRLVDHRHMR